MPPSLARYFVEEYSSAGDLVLDPFVGKGTVLLEASLLERNTIGFDVAPDALIVTNAKLNPPSAKQVMNCLERLTFNGHSADNTPWQVRTFFHTRTLSQLLSVRRSLLNKLEGSSPIERQTANFLLGTLLGILHGHSKLSLSLPCAHSFAMAPHYVREYARRFGLRRPYRDVKECLLARAEELLAHPPPSVKGKAFLSGAEKYIPRVGDKLTGSVDLILTSPPYLNVQTYAKDAWLRLWLLGYDYKSIKSRFIETGSPRLYLQRLTPCLSEMLRVLKPSGYAVIIAGDAPCTVNGQRTFFKTAQELETLATRLAVTDYTFEVEKTILDEIPPHAKCYSAVHKDEKFDRDDVGRKGVRFERIVVLKKVKV
jgi:site-specific DNA-methyltransferase (adenine-specific)